jgi:hypothetical protein
MKIRPEVVDCLYSFDPRRYLCDRAALVGQLVLAFDATPAEVGLAYEMRVTDAEHAFKQAQDMLAADPGLRSQLDDLLAREPALGKLLVDLEDAFGGDEHASVCDR